MSKFNWVIAQPDKVGEGKRGPITAKLQKEFFGIVRGEIPDRHGWLVPVS